jgi:hypothetical protein
MVMPAVAVASPIGSVSLLPAVSVTLPLVKDVPAVFTACARIALPDASVIDGAVSETSCAASVDLPKELT